jgi:hypothetical protein
MLDFGCLLTREVKVKKPRKPVLGFADIIITLVLVSSCQYLSICMLILQKNGEPLSGIAGL